MFAIGLSYVNPLVNFIDAWRDSGAERAQLQELKGENQTLRSRATALEGPDVEELAARRLGMVAEGEASYVIKGLR